MDGGWGETVTNLLAAGRISVLILALALNACILQPGGDVANAAMVVHTAGATQHTAAVRMPVRSDKLYVALLRIIESEPDIEVLNRNDRGMLLEVAEHGEKITGQITKLSDRESLLYLWADTGVSGRSASELNAVIVERICNDLGVTYERVDY